MKSLNPRNKNPRYGVAYLVLAGALIEAGGGLALITTRISIGNNTVASFMRVGHDDPQAIGIYHGDRAVAILRDDDTVQCFSFGDTASEKARLDWCLRGVGMRSRMVGRTPKIYSINTGAFRDFYSGMIVTKESF